MSQLLVNLEEKYGGAPILPLSSPNSTEDGRKGVSSNRRFARLPHDELLCLWDNALTIFHKQSQSTSDSRSLLRAKQPAPFPRPKFPKRAPPIFSCISMPRRLKPYGPTATIRSTFDPHVTGFAANVMNDNYYEEVTEDVHLGRVEISDTIAEDEAYTYAISWV